MVTAALRPHDAAFLAIRRVLFGIVLASFVLFFHRTAPAAIASELTRAFTINAAVLGTLATTYFFVYTILQIPVGVLADTLGPRRILSAGSLIAGAGSLIFALAPRWEIAAIGRTLVGVGVSVAFIAILKVTAVWFPANRFATLTGTTMLAGNLGAVIAGAPLAWAVTQTSWRTVFVALAVLWAVPWLEHAYGMSRVTAAQHASALLLGVASGSLAVGMIWDRLRSRRGVMRVYTLLYVLSWLLLLLRVALMTLIESGDTQSSRRIDEIVYGQKP